MNKVVLSELKSRHLIFEIVLYAIYAIVGFTLLGVCDKYLCNITEYAYSIFFVLAFFTIFVYFLNRRPINYELLFLGFINVLIGTSALLIKVYPESGFLLSDLILVYAMLNIINKLYCCKILIKEKDISFFPKISVTILLFFIGVLVVSLLHTKMEAGVLIFGYYFAIFGLLSMLEPLTKILCNNKTLQEAVFNFLGYEKEDNKKIVLKETKVSKPKVKRTRKVTTKESESKNTKTKKSTISKKK